MVSENIHCVDAYSLFFFLMIRRPPRSTLDRSSAASDVYKRQAVVRLDRLPHLIARARVDRDDRRVIGREEELVAVERDVLGRAAQGLGPVSYTHLRAHETVLDLVCRLLLEKKNRK